MFGFEVRPMAPEDVPDMVRMYSQSWIDTYTNPDRGITREWVEARVAPRSAPQNLERLAGLIADTDPVRGVNWVAVSNGAVIGMCRPYCDGTGRCHVGAIYVDKAWHGKGIGAALMERILEWVGPRRDVELHVATYNERARRFYTMWGFVEQPGSEALYDGLIEEVKMVRPSPGLWTDVGRQPPDACRGQCGRSRGSHSTAHAAGRETGLDRERLVDRDAPNSWRAAREPV